MPPVMGQRFLRRRHPVKLANKQEEEEEFKEMVGVTRTRSFYFRRCKRFRQSFDECIPDELLFEILVRLPAQDICFGARFVCRKWYHMTRTKNFIQKHLDRTSYELLYVNESIDSVLISATEDGKGINTHKLKYYYGIRDSLCPVWASCNGLMLEYVYLKELIYCVTNALTGQTFRLPPYPHKLDCCEYSAIGYDAASMTYKVVVSYRESRGYYGYAIFTVGVDKSWRIVRTNHLSELGRKAIFDSPIVTEGFVHWHRHDSTEVVTLNLETEIMTETFPPVVLKEKTKCCCLSAGRNLSLFLPLGKLVWEVFEMKPETGEWRKLPNICLEAQKGKIKRLGFKYKDYVVDIKPCGWLKYPEVLALRIQRESIIFYNLVTCEIGAEKLSILGDFILVIRHKNSLVWSGGF